MIDEYFAIFDRDHDKKISRDQEHIVTATRNVVDHLSEYLALVRTEPDALLLRETPESAVKMHVSHMKNL